MDNCVSLDHVTFLSVSLNDCQLIRLQYWWQMHEIWVWRISRII